VHYATFISARAYLSAGMQKQDQLDSAVSVLQSMIQSKTGKDLIGVVAKSRTGDARDIASGAEEVPGAFIGTHPMALGNEMIRSYSWAEGVQYNFEVPLYILPLARWVEKDKGKMIQVGDRGEATSVEWKGSIPFASDAWLGRERTYIECREDMTRLSTQLNIGRIDGAEFIEDNGC